MADITILSRLAQGQERNVDISSNTLVTLSIKVGGGVSNTELTKAILDRLVSLQNGSDVDTSYHTHDTIYYRKSALNSSTSGSAGSTLIGDNNSYSNFTPTAATVKGAFQGIDTALGSIAGFANTALSNLASVAINTSLLAGTDNSINLGSAAKRWAAAWILSLKDASGQTQIDLLNRRLQNTSSSTTLDWQAMTASDSGSNVSVDWGNRELKTSGGTIVANWATLVLYDTSGLASMDWTNRLLKDSSANSSLDYNNRVTKDSSGVSSVDWQNRNLLNSSGSTIAGWSGSALNLNSNKIINVAAGSNPNDAVNYSQLTSLSTGLVWQNPVNDPDLVDDSLSTPPGSPVYSLLYIVGASGTGAWSGLDGHAVWWDGTQWIDLSTGNLAASGQGTAVQNGDRFLVASATAQLFTFTVTAANATAGAVYTTNGYNFQVQSTITGGTTLLATSLGFPAAASGTLTLVSGTGDATIAFSAHTEQVGGGLAGQNHKVATVTSNTPGSFAYTFATPANNWAISDITPGSQHYNDSFTYSSTQTNWINFAGPSKVIPGAALLYVGNTLNVQYDNVTIGLSGNQLQVKNGGISNTQISASAAIAYSKLALTASIVNSDISPSAAIAYSKLSLANSIINSDISATAAIAYSKLNLNNSIQLSDMTSNSVDENKIVSTTYDPAGAIVGGSGTKVKVQTDNTSTEISSNHIRVKSGAYDQVSIVGGSGTVASVANAPQGYKVMVAGQTFTANTSYAVRKAINAKGETTGQIYAADKDATTYNQYACIGIALSTTTVNAGGNIPVWLWGDYNMGSSDTAWASGDIGKEIFVGSSGAIIRGQDLAGSANEAAFCIGVIEDTGKLWIDFKQLRGIA